MATETQIVEEAIKVVTSMVDASLNGRCEEAQHIMNVAIDVHDNGELLGHEIIHRLVCGLANATIENAAIRQLNEMTIGVN